MGVVREVEAKVRIGETAALPVVAGVVPEVTEAVPGEAVELTATYFDTADLRLVRWGVTLRRRTGGDDAGWHLKLPESSDGVLSRDEVQLPLAGDAGGERGGTESGDDEAIPTELARTVAPLVREAPLLAMATVRTRRTPYTLQDATGRALATLTDDVVTTQADGQPARSFREIEVEADGELDPATARDVVERAVDALARSGGTRVARSKAAEALGPRAAGEPDVVVPPTPQPDDPVGDVVRWVLAVHARKLLLHDVGVRRNQPDAVHQLRVAARTLRSALRTFRPLLDRAWSDALDEELDRAAEALRVPRDTEVHLAGLQRAAAQLASEDREAILPVLREELGTRLADSTAAALEQFGDEQHTRMLVDVVAATRSPQLTEKAARPTGEELPKLLKKSNRRLRRATRDLDLESPAADWHHARIRAKHARYAAEAARPILGGRFERSAHSLEDVTDLLGDHQDRQVAREVLRGLAEGPNATPQVCYALGLLEAGQMARAEQDREEFLRRWPRLRRTLAP